MLLFKPDPDLDTPLSLILERSFEELCKNSLECKYYKTVLKILERTKNDASVLELYNNRKELGIKTCPLVFIICICLLFPEKKKDMERFFTSSIDLEKHSLSIYFQTSSKIKDLRMTELKKSLQNNVESLKYESINIDTPTYVGSDKCGRNYLMLCVRFHPGRVDACLEEINKLDQESVMKILTKTDHRQRNALMIAAKFSPISLLPLIKVIRNLEQKHQDKILNATDNEGLNALKLLKNLIDT